MIWFYTIIYTALFLLSCLMLSAFGLTFRAWGYIWAAAVIAAGFSAGLIQVLVWIKNKILKTVCTALSVIILFYSFWIGVVSVAFGYMPEYVVERDGQKYVIFVNSFLKTSVYYYDYKNFLVMGRKRQIEEYYGKAYFDPEDMEGNQEKVERVIYLK